MRILITGAYGLIGSAILARLHRDGHALVGAGRALAVAGRRFPYARWVEADFARLVTAAAWRPLLAGIEAVVNCVGVLQDSARDDTRRVHVEATCALFEACAQAGIRRVVHVSAIGAARDGPTDFSRTKAEADARLSRLDLDWVILRPGLVLAPAAFGGTAMLRGLAGVPFVTPVVGAQSRIQVVAVDDVTETVALSVRPGAPATVTWELAHPHVHTLGGIVAALRAWLGFPPQPLLALPPGAGRVVSLLADALGWLGWRSPARSTALAQLTAGVVGDPAPWMAATGIKPRSLDDILAATPSGVQERWFARLYLLKPVAILALALFWSATGVIALGPARAAAMAQLNQAGVHGLGADVTLIGGAVFGVVLGVLLLVRRLARPVLVVMLAATPFYVLAGSVLAPQLWADPLGPLTKTIPLLVATALTLAILDER
ncbi:MAG: hypothetical protein QOI12_5043 [Alphaproteobacteria bacterium]|jgi:uncharacterized protein YbjT (DUF2867 family)|nr:hypothetical protein [Alphaproteobacteria bacterium]